MHTNLITQMKQANSLKDTACQHSQNEQTIWTGLFLLKKVNQLNSLVNSTKYLKKKLYQFCTILFRGEKQTEYFLSYSITLTAKPDNIIRKL